MAEMTPERARTISRTIGEVQRVYWSHPTAKGDAVVRVFSRILDRFGSDKFANAEPWYADDEFAARVREARAAFEGELRQMDVWYDDPNSVLLNRTERVVARLARELLEWFDAWLILQATKFGMQENHELVLHSKIFFPRCPHCGGELTYIDTPELDRFQCVQHGEVTEAVVEAWEATQRPSVAGRVDRFAAKCPVCGAEGGKACIGVRGQPLRVMHKERGGN